MQTTLPPVDFLSYPVFAGTLDSIALNTKKVFNTINQYSYCVAETNSDFREALQESDVLLPDGIGVVLSVKFLSGQTINKIAGADIHQYMLNHYNELSGSCFYLGASDTTLTKIRERVAKNFPNLKVGTYSPPYKAHFSEEDSSKMVEAVNTFKPDVLFVGMTAPKQETWIHQHKNQLDVKQICAIGAVFDFYAGTVNRPSQVWIDMGLEWFVRLLKEPKRMWKRYLIFGPRFLGYIIDEKFKNFRRISAKTQQ